MAKRKIHHSRGGAKISLLTVLGVAPTAVTCYNAYKSNGLKSAADTAIARFTGWDAGQGKFNMSELVKGWGPLILGGIGHKLANKFGVNRALSSVPFVNL